MARKHGEALALLLSAYFSQKIISEMAAETGLSREYISATLRRQNLTHTSAPMGPKKRVGPKDKWAVLYPDGTWSGPYISKPGFSEPAQVVRCRSFDEVK